MYEEIMFFAGEQPVAFYLFLFMFGAAFGSFLNVAAFRTPIIMKNEFIKDAIAIIDHFNLGNHEIKNDSHEHYTTLGGRSFCPSCSKPIPMHHNIPVLSWFILKGKSKCCNESFSFRYPLVEMISGAALASSIYFAGIEFGIYTFAIYSLLYVIATCDNKMSVIPNGPVLVIGILGLVMACRGDVVTIEDALSIGIVTFIFLKLLARFFALGGGDILLYSALSVVIGTDSLWLYVLSGIFSSIIYLIKKKKIKIKSLSEKPLIQHGPAIAISGAILIFITYM